MRVVIVVLFAMCAAACGNDLTAPTPRTKAPYISLFNPQPTPRDQNACYDYGHGFIVCPVE